MKLIHSKWKDRLLGLLYLSALLGSIVFPGILKAEGTGARGGGKGLLCADGMVALDYAEAKSAASVMLDEVKHSQRTDFEAELFERLKSVDAEFANQVISRWTRFQDFDSWELDHGDSTQSNKFKSFLAFAVLNATGTQDETFDRVYQYSTKWTNRDGTYDHWLMTLKSPFVSCEARQVSFLTSEGPKRAEAKTVFKSEFQKRVFELHEAVYGVTFFELHDVNSVTARKIVQEFIRSQFDAKSVNTMIRTIRSTREFANNHGLTDKIGVFTRSAFVRNSTGKLLSYDTLPELQKVGIESSCPMMLFRYPLSPEHMLEKAYYYHRKEMRFVVQASVADTGKPLHEQISDLIQSPFVTYDSKYWISLRRQLTVEDKSQGFNCDYRDDEDLLRYNSGKGVSTLLRDMDSSRIQALEFLSEMN